MAVDLVALQESERVILAGMYADAKLRRKMGFGLNEILFTNPENRLRFKILQALSKDGVLLDLDVAATASRLNIPNQNWQGISNAPLVPEEIYRAHYSRVLEEGARHEMLQASIELSGLVYERNLTVDELANNSIRRISRAQSASSLLTGKSRTPDLVQRTLQTMAQRMSERKLRDCSGISTGFNDLNAFTDGFQPGVALIGSRPGFVLSDFGRTLVNNIAVEPSQKNPQHKIMYVSGNQSEEHFMTRLICLNARLNYNLYLNGLLSRTGEDNSKLIVAADKISRSPLAIYDKLTTPASIYRHAEFEARAGDLGMVIIDKFGDFIRPMPGLGTNELQLREQAFETSYHFKRIAQDFNIPVVVLCELSSDIEKRARGGIPKIADFRMYGTLEDAHPIIALHRPRDADERFQVAADSVELAIYNNVFGQDGDMKLTYLRDIGRFENFH